MKFVARKCVGLGIVFGLWLSAAPVVCSAMNVGFQEVRISNGDEPPIKAGIWYPTDSQPTQHNLDSFTQSVALDGPIVASKMPLVVLSHGGGGSFAGHYDTALALAHAGFVAAALSHTGDTYDDQSKVMQLWRRPDQLRRLVSYLLQEWPEHYRIDAKQIGAFGFSNGGFTVLVAAGAVPDLTRIGPYCHAHPGHDLCGAIRQAGLDPENLGLPIPSDPWHADSRIKAVVVAAPAFGFAFGPAGLRQVHVPVQLWRAAEDRHQPNPEYEEVIRRGLPETPEYHVIPAAGHYAFLPPCSAVLAEHNAQICKDAAGFDRARFHKDFNTDVVRFFRASLR